MPIRKRNAAVKTKNITARTSDAWPLDEILAPNSDTECEPLSKRHKNIESIAQYVRDGGELHLISTSLRGPVIINPWARRQTTTGKVKNKIARGVPEHTKSVERVLKRKRNAVVKTAATKDGKVNQYFHAQKSSQEREFIRKKKLEKYATEDDDPIEGDTQSPVVEENPPATRISKETSPSGFKAIPRIINFDQIPQSMDISTQNFPTLQLLFPQRLSASPPPPASDIIPTSSGEGSKPMPEEEGERLINPPTPEETTISRTSILEPPAGEIEEMKMPSDESTHADRAKLGDEKLHDETIFKPAPPASQKSHSDNDSPILPASLTVHPRSLSPIKPAPSSPSESIPEPHSEGNQSPNQSNPHNTLPPFQQFLGFNNPHCPATPQLTTQSFLDLANQSFNAILPTASAKLLHEPPLTCKFPERLSKSPKPLPFTPFRELNASPIKGEISFKLSSAQESPLTYSPYRGDPSGEETLWTEVKAFLGAWNLDEEVAKYEVEKESQGKGDKGSQECLVNA